MKKKIRWSSLLVSLVVAAVVLICPTFLNRYSLGVVNTALIYGMAGWGISVLLGMGGQLSFASISFMGIGGYAVANFCTGRLPFTLPPLAALFASLVVCGIFAWVLGLILFKLKGTYFTFATIALVQVAFTFFNNYRPLFGGPDGINGIPTLSVGGAELSGYNHWFYFLVVLLVVLGIVVERIRRTQLGRSLASIRDNETAAMTLGVDIYHTKVIAFVIAGLLSGLAGALYAMHIRFISADMFNYNSSTQIIIMAMLGGVNNTVGVIIGALLVGVSFAKSVAYGLGVPLIPVHHVRGHIAANYLTYPDLEPPFICLVASGGHSHIIEVLDYDRFRLLGHTRDDAAGEAFDKVARALGLPYPGGPELEKLALSGDPKKYPFHSALNHSAEEADFSFSGIKTAVVNLMHNAAQKGEEISRADVAASFQRAVCDTLTLKAVHAARAHGSSTLALAGGVSANRALRGALARECEEQGIRFCCPDFRYCTDNAAMIACAGHYALMAGELSGLDLNAAPELPLVQR